MKAGERGDVVTEVRAEEAQAISGINNDDHVDSIVLSDLGDVLASDSSDATGTNINGVTVEPLTVRRTSWREEVEHLMWVIDRKNEELGRLARARRIE